MRITSHPETRSTKNIKMESRPQHWMQSKHSPRNRWEDDINQFFKLEETDETQGNDLKNNDTWTWVAKDQKRWKA